MSERFDVFLSHNSKDKSAVRGLASRLEADGLKVWFDERDLRAGDELHKAIAQGLDQSRVCAVFIGTDGLGPWHDWEIGIAVSLHVNSPDFRLIPVILPRTRNAKFAPNEVPLWLRGLLWVEFAHLDDDGPYQRLKDAILGRSSEFKPRAIRQIDDDTQTSIVPRGLRSFEESDKHFFLRLVAGPRDHRGLPSSIAFWKDRLEQVDPDKTFRVGLLFGPSGCGKSSLIKAGLLPRLHQFVKTIYVEATPDRTEQQLLHELRKQVAGLPNDLGLVESLGYLTSHPEVLNDFKVVIFLDQFEQWLHANHIVHDAPLLAAMRTFDGAVVQAVILVRTDFYVETHRFFEQLGGVRIQDDINARLLDLFDRDHARNVLLEYGRAYGRFTTPQPATPDEAFLSETLDQLQDSDRRLIAVQLALFADLMSSKLWTGTVLRKLGGATGVGRAFLEETFDAKTANASHRVHRKAAIAVLKELLPPRGGGIKGTSKSKFELSIAADYQNRPNDFAGLLEVLLSDLKLISPVAVDDDAASLESAGVEPRYQLSHDYLVPALREWLTAKDKETGRGRAQLALAERTQQWTRDPQDRFLPTLAEFVAILWFVPRSSQTIEQQKLIDVARRRFARRAGVVATALLLLLGTWSWTWNYFQEERAIDGVAAVLNAPPDAVPYAIQNVAPLRLRAMSKFRRALTESQLNQQRLHAALALASFGEPLYEPLVEAVANGESGQCANLVAALRPTRAESLRLLTERFDAATSPTVKSRFATVALHLGDVELAKRAMKLDKDPSVRTAFVHGFPQWHGNLSDLLSLDPSDSTGSDLRCALASALGLLSDAEVAGVRGEWGSRLRAWYLQGADCPTHSAAYFALRRWKCDVESPPQEPHNARRDWFVVPIKPAGATVEPHALTMVKVPAGEFLMGSDKGYKNEKPVHLVQLGGFYLSDREITVWMFSAFMAQAAPGQKPAEWKGAGKHVSPTDECPVQNVSWFDAVQFCNWLSRERHRTICYSWGENGDWKCDFAADCFRLPTEKEWEYACRAASQTEYSFGDEDGLLPAYAVYYVGDTSRTRPGAEKLPNGWGLFDMSGNVWEWCWDLFDRDYNEAVRRGGSWSFGAGGCRSANRDWRDRGDRDTSIGFRVATGQRGDE